MKESLNKFLFSIIFTLLLFSCQEHARTVVNIDIQSEYIKLDSLIIESIVCLETNDEALIGQIHKIRYFKGHYYVHDLRISKNLFLFDSDGKYISSLQRGRGPAEVTEPTEFIIDEANENIFVFDFPTKNLIKYDLFLNFISSEYHENLVNIRNAEFIDNNILLINYPVKNNPSDDDYCLYGLYSLPEKKFLANFLSIDENFADIMPIFPISIYKDRILFSKYFDNNLYTLNLNQPYHQLQAEKEMYFDFGDLTITNNDRREGTRSIFEKSWQGNKIVPFFTISENESFITFNYSLNRKYNFVLYSKDTGKYYISESLFNQGLLPECILNYSLDNNRFLAYAEAGKIQRFIEQKVNSFQTENLSEFSNECIIIFKTFENKKHYE